MEISGIQKIRQKTDPCHLVVHFCLNRSQMGAVALALSDVEEQLYLIIFLGVIIFYILWRSKILYLMEEQLYFRFYGGAIIF